MRDCVSTSLRAPLVFGARASPHARPPGAVYFVGATWLLGWAHLWTQLPSYRRIDRGARLVGMPEEGGIALQLKVFSVAYEGYV